MAKVQIKSEKLSRSGEIFSIMEQFDALLAQTIDFTLGLGCTLYGLSKQWFRCLVILLNDQTTRQQNNMIILFIDVCGGTVFQTAV